MASKKSHKGVEFVVTDASESYREDPDASVSDRIEIRVNHAGRIA